jgi:hypothetical protein
VTTAEDTAKAIVLTGSDADGDALTYTIVTQSTNGTLSGTAPSVTYTPALNYNGSDSFTFKVNDGTADSAVATVSLTVTAVNDAPVFTVDPVNEANATEDVAYVGSVANATDAEGDTLSYSKIAGPVWLAVATDGSLSGTPAQSDVGANVFTVQVDDGNGGSDTATLNITVDAVTAGGGVAGLWYGTASGNINTNDPNPETLVTIDLSQTEDSIAGNTTEIYTGEIYDEDGHISFTEHIDDKTRLWIDGVLVLSSDSFGDRVSTTDLNLAPGWHTFELRISNGGGGSGPRSSPGFGYDPNGGTSWVHPEDPGDGSLFRTAPINVVTVIGVPVAVVDGGHLVFDSISNANYTIESKLNLVDPTWNFYTNILGDSSTISVPMSTDQNQGFFRVLKEN